MITLTIVQDIGREICNTSLSVSGIGDKEIVIYQNAEIVKDYFTFYSIMTNPFHC